MAVSILLLLLIGGMVLLWPYLLARLDLFFTFVREGEAKIVVRGERYQRTIFSLKGHRISSDGTIESTSNEPRKKIWERLFGVYWVGIPPFQTIHRYFLRWTSYKPKGVDGKKAPEVNEETLSSVFIKAKVYYGLILDVETNEGVPLKIEFLTMLQVVNPYRAIFLVNSWVETVIDRISQQARVYVGQRSYADLLTKETSDPKEGFSGFLFDDTTKGVTPLASIIRQSYGVQVISCDLLSLDPPESYRKATTAAYEAERTKEATIKAAEAEAQSITLKSTAQAEAIRAIGDAEAEAIRKRSEAFVLHPKAAKAILDAEVGKAQGVGNIAAKIAEGLGLGRKSS